MSTLIRYSIAHDALAIEDSQGIHWISLNDPNALQKLRDLCKYLQKKNIEYHAELDTRITAEERDRLVTEFLNRGGSIKRDHIRLEDLDLEIE